MHHTTPPTNRRPSPEEALCRIMDRAGWWLDFVDLDLTGGSPVIEIRAMRYDGLWLRAYIDQLGRATIERFQRERGLRMAQNEKGRRPLVPYIEDHFIGRQRYAGGRVMMRGLCAYLTDNALFCPVALRDMRGAWAAIMQGPARITGEPHTNITSPPQ